MHKQRKTKNVRLKPGDIVLIDWHDAAGATRAWQNDVEVVSCTSVGFVVKLDKDQIVIAHTRAQDGDHGGSFAIPRGFIKEYKIVG